MFKYLSVISIFVGALAGPACANAGSVVIVDDARHFDVSVRVRQSVFEDGRLLEMIAANAQFDYGPEVFSNSGYAVRIFSITWTPVAQDTPATGVQEFTIELPVILRAWRADDTYTIYAGEFEGIGNRWMGKYEQMSNAQDQWQRMFASFQQAYHYSHRIRPTIPEVERTLNTAIDALGRISRSSEISWLETPIGLGKRVEDALEDSESKKVSLLKALQNVDSQIWKDVPQLKLTLSDASCVAVRGTIRALDNRKRDRPEAYDLQFPPGDKTYETVRGELLAEHCS